jgi:hypothetical protein
MNVAEVRPGSLRFLIFAFFVALARTAAAQPPDPALLERLAHQAEAFAQVEKSASYRQETVIEELDGDGKVSSTETQVARVVNDGKTTRTVLEKCIRNGQDVTAEEQQKDHKDDVDVSISFPAFTSSPTDYTYDQVGVDPADATKVKIAFTPKKPTKETIEGTLWADTATGAVLSVGARFTKTPMFVDWAHFTVEFGAKTPLGPAMSRLDFEAKAGFLFLMRKHLRGSITMTDYQVPSERAR